MPVVDGGGSAPTTKPPKSKPGLVIRPDDEGSTTDPAAPAPAPILRENAVEPPKPKLPEWEAAPEVASMGMRSLRTETSVTPPATKVEQEKKERDKKPTKLPKGFTRLTVIPPSSAELERVLDEKKTSPGHYEGSPWANGANPSPEEIQKYISELEGDDGVVTSHTDSSGTTVEGQEWIDRVEVVDLAATKEKRRAAWAKARKSAPVSREMTEEQYDALSPMKRDAVDFNTLLVNARELDLNFKGKVRGDGREEYDDAVEKMFGPNDGNEAGIDFAPETLSLLQQLQFEAPETGLGSDIDDFLKLDVALTGRELQGLNIELPGKVPDTSSDTSAPAPAETFETDLLGQITGVKQEMTKAGALLQDFQSSIVNQSNSFRMLYGIKPAEVETLPGYGNTEKDQYFRNAFTALSSRENQGDRLAGVWADINAVIPEGDPDRQEFFDYIDRVSGNKADYRAKLPGENQLYRTPQEFRELLGLSEEKRDARN